MDFEEAKNRVMRSLMDSCSASTTAVDFVKPDAARRWFKIYADFSAEGDLTIIRRDEIDPWSIYAKRDPGPCELQAQHAAEMEAAREQGAKAERARIAEKLAALRPIEEPYTRRDWALEQRGEKRMYDRIMKALFGPEKKGE